MLRRQRAQLLLGPLSLPQLRLAPEQRRSITDQQPPPGVPPRTKHLWEESYAGFSAEMKAEVQVRLKRETGSVEDLSHFAEQLGGGVEEKKSFLLDNILESTSQGSNSILAFPVDVIRAKLALHRLEERHRLDPVIAAELTRVEWKLARAAYLSTEHLFREPRLSAFPDESLYKSTHATWWKEKQRLLAVLEKCKAEDRIGRIVLQLQLDKVTLLQRKAERFTVVFWLTAFLASVTILFAAGLSITDYVHSVCDARRAETEQQFAALTNQIKSLEEALGKKYDGVARNSTDGSAFLAEVASARGRAANDGQLTVVQ